jgi:hypothetical protein
MDKFIDTYVHPKLKQKEIYHLKRSITYKEIEAEINSFMIP